MALPRPISPAHGQESVWDYPRPPRLERVERRLQVLFADRVIADTTAGWRVLETSHPPTYYFPADAIAPGVLGIPRRAGICEWKGRAVLFDVTVDGRTAPGAAWSYPKPNPAFIEIAGAVAFYAGAMQACIVGGVRADPQPGGFYGGWTTPDVAGPFKGGPGTMGW